VHVPPAGGAAAIRALVEKLSGDPFARPIAFTRNRQTPKLKPFALGEVRLGDVSSTRPSRERRLHETPALDRLLHTFASMPGIASTAEPLGGWEDPRGELRAISSAIIFPPARWAMPAWATRNSSARRRHGGGAGGMPGQAQ